MPVKHINSDSAYQTAMKAAGSRPVCVDFSAEWCGPCKNIAPVFEQLSTKYPGVVFLKVDVDDCPGTSSSNGVSAMPTFIMFVNRMKKDSVRGADASAVESMIRKYAYSSGGSTVGGGQSTGGAASMPEPAEEPGIWTVANERLRGMGVPNVPVAGFVFEPASLVLALVGLLMYGPMGPIIVLAVSALAQTSASPFDRYTPSAAAGNSGSSTGGAGPSRPSPTAFSGQGRRLGD